MSDLISRSDVVQILKECNLDETLFEKDVFDKINNLPMAYSVDKVVEELEKIEQHCLDMSDWQGQSAICDAIEIVKHGDVSDDVCEWKRDDMLYTVYKICGGCFTSVYQKDFKYCPYCGKKIKVVE